MPLKLFFNDKWILQDTTQNLKSPCSKCKFYSEFMCYITCCPNTLGNFWWMFVMKKNCINKDLREFKGDCGINISIMFLKTIDSWIEKSLCFPHCQTNNFMFCLHKENSRFLNFYCERYRQSMWFSSPWLKKHVHD
jgi:hypothetical protein